MSHALTYLIALCLVVPLAAYVWAALRTPRSRVSTTAGYFIAYRQVGTAPFANSSLAYAFQVATLFPFLYWGIQGQILPAVVNAIAWGLGIFAFRCCLGPILARLGTGSPKTLHGLLGEAHSSTMIQRIAAGVTICGMIGIALGEAYWGMQVVKVIVPEDTPAYYAIVFGSLLFVLTYVWYGGTWGSIKTDMLQLVFSYLGFTTVFLFALCTMVRARTLPPPESVTISALMWTLGAIAVAIRISKRIAPVSQMEPRDNALYDPALDKPSLPNEPDENLQGWSRLAVWLSRATTFAIVILVLCFLALFIYSVPAGTLAALANPGDPKWQGIAALAILGLLFQFVDMSAWQRLQAIGGSAREVKDHARWGLLLFSVESPFSWIMCAALGMLLIVTMPQLASAPDKAGPLAAYPRLLIETGSYVNIGVGIVFMIAVMGVMLSTIDSVLLAAMYAFVADVKGCKFRTEESSPLSEADRIQDRQELLSGKTAAFWLITGVSGGIVVFGWLLQSPDKLIGIMVGFYGAMLALFPAVVMMLKRWRWPSGQFVGFGMVAAVVVALAFTIWGIFDSDKAWYAVLLAPSIAAVVPLLCAGIATCSRGPRSTLKLKRGRQ